MKRLRRYAVGSDLALATLHVYAALAEMLRRRPLDLHVHTTFPTARAHRRNGAARREGLDVLAVTDHGSYEGSQAAIEAAASWAWACCACRGGGSRPTGTSFPRRRRSVGPVSAGYPGLREALTPSMG